MTEFSDFRNIYDFLCLKLMHYKEFEKDNQSQKTGSLSHQNQETCQGKLARVQPALTSSVCTW